MNSAGFCYKSLNGSEAYGFPTGLLFTGRGNRNDPRFQELRQKGCEVYFYLDVCEVSDPLTIALDKEYYGAVEKNLWPYPNYGERFGQIYPTYSTRLSDMKEGSDWFKWTLEYIANLIKSGQFDGILMDTLGDRRWSTEAAWDTWSKAEQDIWTQGNRAMLREVDLLRCQINDLFKIVPNGTWDLPGSEPSWALMDGRMYEHHSPNAFQLNSAKRPYGHLNQRRVVVISKADDVPAWIAAEGVTHVSSNQSYASPTPPPAGFYDLRPAEYWAKIQRLEGK